LRVVLCSRQDGCAVVARDRLAESEVGGEHGHAVGELCGAEANELLDERSAGTQTLRRSRLHVVCRTGQHCGQRHSLSEDDEADDQYEKSFGETAHETDSNARWAS